MLKNKQRKIGWQKNSNKKKRRNRDNNKKKNKNKKYNSGELAIIIILAAMPSMEFGSKIAAEIITIPCLKVEQVHIISTLKILFHYRQNQKQLLIINSAILPTIPVRSRQSPLVARPSK